MRLLQVCFKQSQSRKIQVCFNHFRCFQNPQTSIFTGVSDLDFTGFAGTLAGFVALAFGLGELELCRAWGDPGVLILKGSRCWAISSLTKLPLGVVNARDVHQSSSRKIMSDFRWKGNSFFWSQKAYHNQQKGSQRIWNRWVNPANPDFNFLGLQGCYSS